MKKQLILAAFVAFATAVPAMAAGQPCVLNRDLDGWGGRDKHSMVVNDRFGRKYLVNLQGFCDDVNWSLGVGFRALGGANMNTCISRGDRVVMRGGGAGFGANNICWVSKIQPYTPEMQDADKLAKQNHQPLNAY
jgi:hypothetical protein